MDSTVATPRETVLSIAFLRSEIPKKHPTAEVLGEERLGAGVAVAPDRILTAHYLVLGASRVEVSGIDGQRREVQRTVVDHETGLALLLLGGPPFRAAKMGGVEVVAPGLPVFLMSWTDSREVKGATGHVSVVGPFEAFWEYMLDRAIMTTVINPGFAGAPLFDKEARLIGLVSLGLAAVGRYSLAIPVEMYLRRRESLESEEGARVRPGRAWVGIYPQGYDGGVVLTGIVPGGPADRAGLERGDLILSVDGQPISNLRELYRAIWRKTPGESVGFQVLRESSIRVVDVASADRYDFYR